MSSGKVGPIFLQWLMKLVSSVPLGELKMELLAESWGCFSKVHPAAAPHYIPSEGIPGRPGSHPIASSPRGLLAPGWAAGVSTQARGSCLRCASSRATWPVPLPSPLSKCHLISKAFPGHFLKKQLTTPWPRLCQSPSPTSAPPQCLGPADTDMLLATVCLPTRTHVS